jgi:hypothetical protein
VRLWLNRDPLGDEAFLRRTVQNLLRFAELRSMSSQAAYSFVRNNPVSLVDGDGLIPDGFTPPPPGYKDPGGPLSCGNRIKNEVWEKYGKNRDNAVDPSAHLAHCIAHCRITRECPGGGLTSFFGGLGKELQDQLKKWNGGGGDGFDWGDMGANRTGRQCGKNDKNRSCEDQCQDQFNSGNLYPQPAPPSPPVEINFPWPN